MTMFPNDPPSLEKRLSTPVPTSWMKSIWLETSSCAELLDLVVRGEDIFACALDGAFHYVVVAIALLALEAWWLCVEALCLPPGSNGIDQRLTRAFLLFGVLRHAGDLSPTR